MPSGRVAGKVGVYTGNRGSQSYSGLNEEIIWISIAMSILIGILILVALCYLFHEKCKKRREMYVNT
ncbi:uncharacterized protein LOC135834890 [Planococcus citri]|uniref:uncharacterized protein LOC135834890 n=1 Tax=Planococcus citri TaxID=170843 RepID=UPI0031F85A47